ncbi:MAG: hypothetical protein WD043_05930, partial [Gemmatimonadales bacterium]
MNRPVLRLVVLSAVVAAATMAVAWWTTPIIGGVFGLVAARRGRPAPVLTPLVAGFLGWMALVIVAAVRGGAGRVAEVMGGILGLPGWALFAVTPLYGAL